MFERVVEACIAVGLVGGEGFAVDASLIVADANKQRSIPGKEWDKKRDADAASRAVKEYVATLNDAAFGAASDVVPKFVSPSDPAAQWTGAMRGPAFFAYADNYLIDVKFGTIMDVEASRAIRQAEVGAAKTMIERTEQRFGIKPERLAADTAYGSGANLEGSPAAEAGLQSGDVVIALGNTEIKDARDLARKVAEVQPGNTLQMRIERNGADRTMRLTAAAYPSDQGQLAASGNNGSNAQQGGPKLGLYLAPAGEVEGASSRGVVVIGVDPQSAAAVKGLQQGDVILDVGGKAVAAPREVSSAIASAKKSGKYALLLRIKTTQGQRYVALPLGRG